MKISVIAPVLNEVDFIGYSIMAALPVVHELIYAVDDKSDDGTRELLSYVKQKYAHEKLVILDHPHFHPHDLAAYNGAFNTCIKTMTGDVAFFLHPDMIITSATPIYEEEGNALAWWTDITSYARDFKTTISKGRCSKWKNLHADKFGLHYYGGYGSANEDFYHRDITGNAYKHYGTEFSRYPFQVADSGISINHYCELKPYKRRLEKMRLCLETQNPIHDKRRIEEMALNHPRVTLESSCDEFGEFEFSESKEPMPDVFVKYKAEFESFKKELVHG